MKLILTSVSKKLYIRSISLLCVNKTLVSEQQECELFCGKEVLSVMEGTMTRLVLKLPVFVFLWLFLNGHIAYGDVFNSGMDAFDKGHFITAIDNFKKAHSDYIESGNAEAQARSLLYLSKSFLYAGKFNDALIALDKTAAVLKEVRDNNLTSEIENTYGVVYMSVGKYGKARESLDNALLTAEKPDIKAEILANLGNLAALLNSKDEALTFYQKSLSTFSNEPVKDRGLYAQVITNKAFLYISLKDETKAQEMLKEAFSEYQNIPDNHKKVEGLIRAGKGYNLIGKDAKYVEASFKAFDMAHESAEAIDDLQTIPYILLHKATLYEQVHDYKSALVLLRKALLVSNHSNVGEAKYTINRLMGRVLKKTGKMDEAVIAYREAVKAVERVGLDAFVNCALCGKDFLRTEVEPIFYELSGLLIQRATERDEGRGSQQDLLEARDTVEQLRAAELKDYFKDTCIDFQKAKAARLDNVSDKTAVLYVISFPEKLELLIGFPSGIKSYTVAISAVDYYREVLEFRRKLEKRTTMEYQPYAQRLYDLLIKPIENDLIANQADTIVYIPDRALRMVPLGALHDGNNFLINKYSVATTPGIFLTNADAFVQNDGDILMAALTEERQGFAPLPFVSDEVAGIHSVYKKGTLLKNQDFVVSNIKNKFNDKLYSLFHIASHGSFTGDAANTFIVTWDGKLTINDLDVYIKDNRYSSSPLEILALSACDTAAGDDRAALGLAGLAVKTGVKSTVASLWSINDEASSQLIVNFYEELKSGGGMKAKALQRAQINMLKNEKHNHPFYWSPFILIGNWL
ncbi:MAG: CHAT domain-containing protein [Nitrospirae bacterium YQR-1]